MTGQLDLIDSHGLAEQAGRAATLAELAAASNAEKGSDHTKRAYREDWALWIAFWTMAERSGHGEPFPLVPDSDALTVYARWLATGGLMPTGKLRTGSAPESIRRRLTGVLAGWRAQNVNYPRDITKDAREWVRWYEAKLIERNESTGRGQAHALTVKDLGKIVETVRPGLIGLRDTALILLDFSVGGRRSELAFLDVSDITPGEYGIEVHIRKSKTGHRSPAVTYGQNSATCPVRAWNRWQQTAGIVTGPAFRAIDRHGNLGGRMSGEAVGAVFTTAGKRAGLPHRLVGHSARRGLATEARKAGHSIEQIADQGGWQRTSPVLHRYIDSVDKWSNNVLAGLGL